MPGQVKYYESNLQVQGYIKEEEGPELSSDK
jgi:hypothetical protein